MKPRIIGLSGYKYSGKGVISDHLVQSHGFFKFEWATRLKNMLHEAGVPWEFLTGSRKEEVVPVFGKTARQLMQTLGTEWGRDMVSQNLWVDLCRENDIKPSLKAGFSVVMEGTRFPNEVKCIRDLGGIVVRVNRPGCGSDGHRSEVLPECDYEIVNDGSREDLCVKFDEISEQLWSGRLVGSRVKPISETENRTQNSEIRHAGPETHKQNPQCKPALPASNG